MSKITTGSNRIYDDIYDIDFNIKRFMYTYYSVYQLYFLYKEDEEAFKTKYRNNSIFKIVSERYNLDTPYANSIIQSVKGIYESQEKCLGNYKNILEIHKNQVEDKLLDALKLLEKYQNLYSQIDGYYKDFRRGKVSSLKTNLKHIKIENLDVKITTKHNNEEYKLLEFKYKYLIPKIRFLKNKISKLKYRIHNYQAKLDNTKLKRLVFYKKYLGSKDFKIKKYSNFQISGRCDGKYKNFEFKMTPEGGVFNIDIRLANGKIINFKNLTFKYKGSEIKYILDNHKILKTPLAYKLISKIDAEGRHYYQIFITFDISLNKRINTDISTGLVGIDFNVGHIDFSETNETGNLIFKKTVYYNAVGTSDERKQSLNKVLNEVFKYASIKHKCIVVEKLNTSKSKAKSVYRNKKKNKAFSDFAYNKYLEECEYLKYKYNLDVIKISPVNTSKIASTKYKYKHLNDHVAASYVIARRGQGFKDRYIKK